jgi:hypothetical protein
MGVRFSGTCFQGDNFNHVDFLEGCFRTVDFFVLRFRLDDFGTPVLRRCFSSALLRVYCEWAVFGPRWIERVLAWESSFH